MGRKKKQGGGKPPFKSKDQWRWAFANKMPFARRWARKTRSYKALPKNKNKDR